MIPRDSKLSIIMIIDSIAVSVMINIIDMIITTIIIITIIIIGSCRPAAEFAALA